MKNNKKSISQMIDTLSKFTKDEIISAVGYKARLDSELLPSLIQRIEQQKADKAFCLWEEKQKESIKALNEFVEYKSALYDKYGKNYLRRMSSIELNALAKKSRTQRKLH